MVLDSTVDPTGTWYIDNVDQDYAFQGRMDAFYAWVARYDSTYNLGSTATQVRAAWYQARNQLLAHPVDGVIGPTSSTTPTWRAATLTNFGRAWRRPCRPT